MASVKNSEFEIQPLRSLDDFILESARFQIPDVKHLDRWGNRVVKNLLYYQSNYFLLYIILVVLIGVLHPKEVVSGAVSCLLIALLYLSFTNNETQLDSLRRKYRNVTIVLVVLAVYFIYHMLNTILVLLVALFFPVAVIFIHASLRLRNFRNKLANHIEMLELRVTPMGLILRQFGLDIEQPKILQSKKFVDDKLKL